MVQAARRVLKWGGFALGILLLVVLTALTWLTTSRVDLSAFESRYAPPARSEVTVRFFGTSSMLFSDGETNVMIDGWFTRPSTIQSTLAKIQPDTAAIDQGLARLGNPIVAALIVGHSHMDHAMDVAEVARRTKAMLVGSNSTANIGRGGGLPEEQIKVVNGGETLQFGEFAVTMIPTRHFIPSSSLLQVGEGTPTTIDEPLIPPVSAYAYREGKTYSILIEHPTGAALIQASPGFEEGALDGIDVDTVYLGVGFLASQSVDYQSALWRETVTATHPESIYLIHWDGFSYPTVETGNRPIGPIRLWNDLFGMRSGDGITDALDRAEMAGVSAYLLPLWDEVDAFAPGHDQTRPDRRNQ